MCVFLGAVKYNAGELVRIKLDEKHHDKITKQQPLRIHQSKRFVVDTEYLNDPDDIKADDLGSWRNDGQHSRWVKVKQVGGQVRAVEFCSGNPKGDLVRRGLTIRVSRNSQGTLEHCTCTREI